MLDYHDQAATVAYHALKQRVLRDEAAGVTGQLERRKVGAKTYLYEKQRLGTDVRSRYIGEDTPDLRARLDAAATTKETAAERRKDRNRLVQVLRAEGFYPLDVGTGMLLSSFAKVGLFRLGGTLVGTNAFLLYEGELGLRLGRSELSRTSDIDIASFERLSVAIGDRVTERIENVLSALQFDPVPSLRPSAVWRWRQTKRDTEVEFLTPSFGEEAIVDLPALGVSAQGLHHLNFLIADPIPAVALYRSGILVQIPRPERFAIHKLIVADRRRDGAESFKARKDRAQAALLVEALAEQRPDELLEAWEDAQARGPKWRQRLEATLRLLPETKARLAAL